MEDSNSGDESYNREDEGNQSPKSESQSRSLSPAPQSPASPRSPCSPQEQDAPESPPSSPSSSRSSPSSPVEQKSSPRSPGSPSSANGQQSEHEASDVEMSDAEEAENKEKDNEENAEKSGDERSEAEDSEREENIPEVNIDSGDEVDNKSEHNPSDNEGEQSGDEDDKDERGSVHVDSDAENKSEDENAASKSDDEKDDNKSDDESVENKNSSPKQPSSPIQTDKDAEDSEDEEIKMPKRKEKDSDAEDNADSDSDAESEISEVGGLIADIFGESDEEEEFEGFKEEDIAAGKAGKEEATPPKKEKRKRVAIMSDSEDEKEEEPEKEENDDEKGVIEDVPAPPDDEEGEVPGEPPAKKAKPDPDDSDDEDDGKIRDDRGDFVSDFDLMMQKKKEESSKRRRRRDVDLISDSDDLIADIIVQMRMAAEEDKELNKVKRTATKKLKILPMVLSQLKKQDLKIAFLDQGVLNVIAEWLTPLPDRSLPHLNIREGMLKQLSDYPNFDPSLLKSSGIGRALMYLYKHPKETKENRERAGKLITEWARPIFNVTTNYHALTKEEREQRDYDNLPKRRRKDQGTSEAEEPEVERKDIEKEMTGESTAIGPGDKGWIGRARVPLPSTKDYVNRPKWNVEMEFGRGPSKKPLTRIEKHMRSIQDKKRLNKQQRAITISIEGRKMAI